MKDLQEGYCLTVMSSEARESVCSGCGQKRVIFQAHYFAFPGDNVRARCKSCHQAAAKDRGGEIFVKTHFRSLPTIWKNDKFDKGTPAQLERAANATRVRLQNRF